MSGKDLDKHLFLVGMMGAGKTTLGKKIARFLTLEFIDTDTQIEQNTGLTVNEIFERHGESYFRSLEQQLLKSVDTKNPKVYSVGGGFPCFNNNMEVMKEKGVVIYLKRDPKELAIRVMQNQENKRPLLEKFKTKEAVATYLENLLSAREGSYSKAHIVLDRDCQNVKEILLQIEGYRKNTLGFGL